MLLYRAMACQKPSFIVLRMSPGSISQALACSLMLSSSGWSWLRHAQAICMHGVELKERPLEKGEMPRQRSCLVARFLAFCCW